MTRTNVKVDTKSHYPSYIPMRVDKTRVTAILDLYCRTKTVELNANAYPCFALLA